MDAHIKPPDPLTKKLTPYYRDFLEVSGNQYRPGRVMPGTCEACVWGRGRHEKDCPVTATYLAAAEILIRMPAPKTPWPVDDPQVAVWIRQQDEEFMAQRDLKPGAAGHADRGGEEEQSGKVKEVHAQ